MFAKRIFDVVLAVIGLLSTFWIIAIAWLMATCETRANGFFKQTRVGKDGKLFKVIKIRTMKTPASFDSGEKGIRSATPSSLPNVPCTTVTTSLDARITRLGRFWRRTKIDELPQLFNVLFGQMSFVGPRPDVPGFADKLHGDDCIILSVRPGITGPATLKYRNEEELLASVDDPEAYNRDVIFPDKVRINREYVENWSFWMDLVYIFKTVFR